MNYSDQINPKFEITPSERFSITVSAISLVSWSCGSITIHFKCEDSGASIKWFQNDVLIVTHGFNNDYVTSFGGLNPGFTYRYSVRLFLKDNSRDFAHRFFPKSLTGV